MQKLFTFIIVILILYNIISLKTTILPSGESDKNSSATQLTGSDSLDENISLGGNLIEKTISKIVINALKTEEGRTFFENIIQPLNKPLGTENYSISTHRDLVTPLFKITTSGSGTIGPASCGHVVMVYYQISDMNNILLHEGSKTFTLGSGTIMMGVDNVVVGMMVGQVREAIIPAKYAYQGEHSDQIPSMDDFFKLKVALHSILPQHFIKSNEVKIFDDEVAYRTPLLCGEKISCNIKITNLSQGSVVYDSKLLGEKTNIKIGDITYPFILSYALHGKVAVGTRTVIAKGKNFRSLGSNLGKIMQNDKISLDEYFMIELGDFGN